MSMTDTIDRIAPTRRPDAKAVGYHCWWHLLFVHWRVPAAEIQRLLPPQLSVDTWDGDAWVGMVPFTMTGVRPWWSPSVPGISNFHETNVRTYVHLDGQDPGVWFFSLEAAQSLAVRIARWGWKLPYYRAEMTFERNDDRVCYRSKRLWPGTPGAMTDVAATVGELIGHDEPDRELSAGQAIPGTLEHWLAERYILYAKSESSPLLLGHVYHTPYPLREANVDRLEESLLEAAGIDPPEGFCSALFSDGVEVEVFPLRAV